MAVTSSDLVETGQHPDHEAGRHGDGVPRLLQHHLVPPHHHLGLLPGEGGLLGRRTPELDIVVNTCTAEKEVSVGYLELVFSTGGGDQVRHSCMEIIYYESRT